METDAFPVAAHNEPPVWQTVGRWIAVLPGAILGSLLGYWAAKLMNWLGSSRFGDDSWGWHLWTIAFEAVVQGWVFVAVAVWIAPSGKRVVAYTAAALIIFFMGANTLLVLPKREWVTLLAIAATIGGAVFGAKAALEENR